MERYFRLAVLVWLSLPDRKESKSMDDYQKAQTLRIMIADLEEKLAQKLMRLHTLQRLHENNTEMEREKLADEVEEEQNLLDLYKRNLTQLNRSWAIFIKFY